MFTVTAIPSPKVRHVTSTCTQTFRAFAQLHAINAVITLSSGKGYNQAQVLSAGRQRKFRLEIVLNISANRRRRLRTLRGSQWVNPVLDERLWQIVHTIEPSVKPVTAAGKPDKRILSDAGGGEHDVWA
ncbi:MAG: hypothetical protein Q9163_005162 [Psora crenata]